MRVLLASLLTLGAAGCCSSYATRGCLTPDEIRQSATRGDFAGLQSLLKDDRSWVREEAAKTLGAYKVRDARGELESMLRDQHERVWVRAAAAEALGLMQDGDAFQSLVGIAGEPGLAPEVKMAAILALCRTGGGKPEALQAIAPLTGDEDLLVAALAEESIAAGCKEPAR